MGQVLDQVAPEYRILPAGDTALVVEFGSGIDRGLSALVLALARRLDQMQLAGITETVPTFRSLMIYYDPLVLPADDLIARVTDLMTGLRGQEQPGRRWRLPACYDHALAPDLDDVAARTGLSPDDVVARHSATVYHVYMLGFLPGQAYMGDVPAELALPRRETPRQKIPAGSLAIAGTMTCIFPMETPCGWHLIGRSPIPLWHPQSQALLTAGDQVTFAPISVREYENLRARIEAGQFTIAPLDSRVGAAA